MSNFQDSLTSIAKAGKDAALVATKQAELKKIQTVDLSKAYFQLGKSVYSKGSERDRFSELHSQVGELQVKIKDLKSQIDSQPEAEKLTDKAKQLAIATKQKAEIKAHQLQTNRLLLELGKEVFGLYGNEAKPVEFADSIRESQKRIELLSMEIHELEESSKGKFLTPKRIIVGVACLAGLVMFASVLSLFSESQNVEARNSLSQFQGAKSFSGNETLTEAFLPFEKGKKHKFLIFDKVIADEKEFGEIEVSFERGNKLSQRSVAGKVSAGFLKDIHFRKKSGFLEFGQMNFARRQIIWEPIIKLGASVGDEWKHKGVFDYTFKYVRIEKRQLDLATKPVRCAIIKQTTQLGSGAYRSINETERIYAEGIGLFQETATVDFGEGRDLLWRRTLKSVE